MQQISGNKTRNINIFKVILRLNEGKYLEIKNVITAFKNIVYIGIMLY